MLHLQQASTAGEWCPLGPTGVWEKASIGFGSHNKARTRQRPMVDVRAEYQESPSERQATFRTPCSASSNHEYSQSFKRLVLDLRPSLLETPTMTQKMEYSPGNDGAYEAAKRLNCWPRAYKIAAHLLGHNLVARFQGEDRLHLLKDPALFV